MKATEQYFPVVLSITLQKVALTFDSVEEPWRCDHSNESLEKYFPVVRFLILNNVVQTFVFCGWNPRELKTI